MLADSTRRTLMVVASAALVIALVLGAVASSQQPSDAVASEGAVVGRAAFAYLGGLRTFAAAVLWNRIEPQFHEYYEGQDLGKLTFMLPTIRLVQTLDPQFQEAYYVGAWIVARNGNRPLGISIARDGLKANPGSGLMYANVIGLLVFDDLESGDKRLHLDEEVALARKGIRPDVAWATPADRFESYAVFADSFARAGMTAESQRVRAEMQRMRDTGVVPNIEREQQKEGN